VIHGKRAQTSASSSPEGRDCGEQPMNHNLFTNHYSRATNDYSPFTINSLVNQVDQSMQNKPNFMKNRANISYCKSKGSENAPPVFSPKIPKPISPGVQLNLSPYISMNYEQRTMNSPGKNKPNSNPIQSQFQTQPCLAQIGFNKGQIDETIA